MFKDVTGPGLGGDKGGTHLPRPQNLGGGVKFFEYISKYIIKCFLLL